MSETQVVLDALRTDRAKVTVGRRQSCLTICRDILYAKPPEESQEAVMC